MGSERVALEKNLEVHMQERRTLIWRHPLAWALSRLGKEVPETIRPYSIPKYGRKPLEALPDGEVVNLRTEGRWRPRRRNGSCAPPLKDPPRIGVAVFHPPSWEPDGADQLHVYVIESSAYMTEEHVHPLLSWYFGYGGDMHRIMGEAAKPKEVPKEEDSLFSTADFGF